VNRAPALDTSARERIAIDATDGDVSVVDIDAHGNGSDFIGALRLAHGVGTLELGCDRVSVAVYRSFVASGAVQYRAIAVKADRLYTLQFECEQGKLRVVWFESTDGTAHAPELLAGSCSETAAETVSRVAFPALEMVPRTIAGYTIDGPEIALTHEGKGSLTLEGVSQELFAFADHRCIENCEIDDWRTLETLVWDLRAARWRRAIDDRNPSSRRTATIQSGTPSR